MQLEELLNIKEVAKILKVSERTVEDWIYQSRKGAVHDPIPFMKINRATRFSPRALAAWIDRRRTYGTVEYGGATR